MITKGMFIKLEKLQCRNVDVLNTFNVMLEDCVCYIIKKVITYNAVEGIDVRYKYSEQRVIDGFIKINQTYYNRLVTNLIDDLENIMYIIEKNVNEAISDFVIYSKNKPNAVLNFNSVLLNKDMLVINAEALDKGALC